ncbi:hypothetical protein AX14_009148 [Amanita brunnescens Koide BX004]|nr:hypothetical protein AX14_009148 [Amanita brunnescens Koide BX004]
MAVNSPNLIQRSRWNADQCKDLAQPRPYTKVLLYPRQDENNVLCVHDAEARRLVGTRRPCSVCIFLWLPTLAPIQRWNSILIGPWTTGRT